jgi:hypothetical protein
MLRDSGMQQDRELRRHAVWPFCRYN